MKAGKERAEKWFTQSTSFFATRHLLPLGRREQKLGFEKNTSFFSWLRII